MNVIVYIRSGNHVVKNRLVSTISSVTSPIQVEFFQNFQEVKDRIRRWPKDMDAAIFFSQDIEGLRQLTTLNDNLKNIPVILILPDMQKTTFSLASRLNPTFTSTMDSDFTDVRAVLEGMVGRVAKDMCNSVFGEMVTFSNAEKTIQ